MELPFFYSNAIPGKQQSFWVEEDTARHIVQVLRMQAGEQVFLTNANGRKALCEIVETGKKKCSLLVKESEQVPPHSPALHLAVAFTRNTSRNEWLLEKATELGAQSITPLLSTRVQKERTRQDRWQQILLSAMLQSQQVYVPVLHEGAALDVVFDRYKTITKRYIAHCIDSIARESLPAIVRPQEDSLFLIGPEGDFTTEEVNAALGKGYQSIYLGKQRLRTETAAMAVCSYFCLIN